MDAHTPVAVRCIRRDECPRASATPDAFTCGSETHPHFPASLSTRTGRAGWEMPCEIEGDEVQDKYTEHRTSG